MTRTRNFRVWNDVVERGSVMTESQKGKKAYVERKVGVCFQWKAHGQCFKGRFSHDTKSSGNSGGDRRPKDDRLLPHPIRRQNRLTVKRATRRKVLTREVRLCVDIKNVKIRRVSFGIFPCVKITSLKKDAFLATKGIADMVRQKESSATSQRKVVRKDQLRY